MNYFENKMICVFTLMLYMYTQKGDKMIPKKIHYCWFGGKSKSDLINTCFESWKKFAPDYEIIEWNESNYDINKYCYTKEAYERKKYAFVSDVVRFDVLYQNGGIYLDTDVELLKSIDCFLNHDIFMGYDQRGLVASGLIFGSVKEHNLLLDFLNYYNRDNFILSNGLPNTTTVVTIVSNILKSDYFELNGDFVEKEGIVIYPAEYFDPYDYENAKILTTENTYALHHYAASWKSDRDMKIYLIGKKIKKIIGNEMYEKLARIKHHFWG